MTTKSINKTKDSQASLASTITACRDQIHKAIDDLEATRHVRLGFRSMIAALRLVMTQTAACLEDDDMDKASALKINMLAIGSGHYLEVTSFQVSYDPKAIVAALNQEPWVVGVRVSVSFEPDNLFWVHVLHRHRDKKRATQKSKQWHPIQYAPLTEIFDVMEEPSPRVDNEGDYPDEAVF
jgi:hypothetical protein